MSKNRKILIAVSSGILMVLLAVVAVYLLRSGGTKVNVSTSDAPAVGPVQISTALATVQEVPRYIQGTGSFIEDEKSDIASKVSGLVVSTSVEVGDFVGQGQVIAQLDDRDARLRLQQARSDEQKAEVAVKQAQVRLGVGRDGKFDVSNVPEVQQSYQNYLAAVQEAKLAAVNERRYANLLDTGDTSRLTYDQQRTKAETTNAQAKAALKQYENTQNIALQNNQGIASAQAALNGARTQIQIAQKAVTDAIIYAPFSGSIDERTVSKGEYVTTASKIATIVRTSPIKLSLPLPEGDAGRVTVGMSISASVAAYPDQNFAGRVAAIQPSLNVDSRSIIVEAEFINTEGKLKPGMFGTARIVLPTGENGVFVPQAAVITDPTTQSSSLYVIKDGKARLQVVQLGEIENAQIRIVSGVDENEIVATSNLAELFDGADVIQ